ncbi:MAG: transketolase, partial [Chitinispirillaceae bacterium]|nr:transketolase [Chitinispirillaceae bacterium]
VELSAGSLGMGISFGIGTQIAARLAGRTYRTYVLTGDGELDEGENWEGFLTGAKYKLDDLTVIVDYNKVQLDGTVDEILPLGELEKKISAFDWNVIECDGHDVNDIIRALDEARQAKGRPNAILAHTIKGKGVSFMENQSAWHGRPPDEKEYERAIAELKGAAL